MKKIYFLFASLMGIASLTSCSDDDGDSVSGARFEGMIDKISGIGGTVNVNVISEAKWVISKTDSCSWFHVTPFTSYGNETVTVDVDPSEQNGVRKGYIYLSVDGMKVDSLLISQGELSIPTAPGAIQGQDAAEAGEIVLLTADSLPDAQQYRWYLNGNVIATTAERTYEAILPGKYAVAGVNSLGEGEKSPEKDVNISKHYVFDRIELAEYKGDAYNSYSQSYHLILTKKVSEITEIGLDLIVTDKAPADADNAHLSSRTYKVCDPYQNDFNFDGRVEGNDEYSLTPWSGDAYGSYLFIRKAGAIVPGSVAYFHKSADMSISVEEDTDGHYVIKGSDLDCFNAIIKKSVNEWGSVSTTIESKEERGLFSFAFEGNVKFENMGVGFNQYSYRSENFAGNYTNKHCESIGVQYDSTNKKVWRVGISEFEGLSESGWELSGYFYPTSTTDPTGVYVVSNVAGKEIPGTVDRGWSRGGYTGTGLTATYWEGLTRKSVVYAQPAANSYVKIEKTGVAKYRVTVLAVDAQGHLLLLSGESVLEFTPMSSY